MRKIIIGFLGVLVWGVACASPWSMSVGLGSALPANAQSGYQGEISTAASACGGCTVTGSAATSAGFLSLGVRYRLGPWVAVSATGWDARSFDGNMTLSGGGTVAPATISDHMAGGYVLFEAHHRFAGRWAWAAGAGFGVTRDSEQGSITVGGITPTFPADTTTRVGPALRAAVSYHIDRRWAAGLSYVELPTVGNSGYQYTAGPLGLASFVVRDTF